MKGNIASLPVILVAIFTLTISVLTAYTILDSVIDSTDQSMIDQEILGSAESALTMFDYGIVFVNASFFIASFIFALRIRSNPVFALPAIFFLGVSVWLSAEIANIYQIFGMTGPLNASALQFPLTTSMFESLPIIFIGLGSILVLLMYTGVGRTEVEA